MARVYLDNCAIKAFAKGDARLRQRVIRAVRNGGDLLFSASHAIEATGPQGKSSRAFNSFLNQLGAHWYPIHANVFVVVEREKQGMSRSDCSFDGELLRAYFQANTAKHRAHSERVIDLSSDSFFKLGNVIRFTKGKRDYLREKCAEFDQTMVEYITKLRAKHKKEPGWLDVVLPADKDLLMILSSPDNHGGHDGCSDTAADVAHEIDDARDTSPFSGGIPM